MSLQKGQEFVLLQQEYDRAERIAAENNRIIKLLKAKLEIAKCNKEEMDDTLKYYEKKYAELIIEYEDISWKQTKAKVILKSTDEYIFKIKSQKEFVAEDEEEMKVVDDAATIQMENDYLQKNCEQNADKIQKLIKEIKQIKKECRTLDK